MKTLNKFYASSGKILSNDELISLKGGIEYTCNYSGVPGVWSEMCGYSRSWVEYWATTYGGIWCCDSCGQTTYCQNS